MRTLSLRASLTLWYSIALVLVLCIAGAGVIWIQGRFGVQRIDRDLDNLAATVASIVRHELMEDDDPAAAAEEAIAVVTGAGRAVAVLDAGGTLLAARWNGLELGTPASAGPAASHAWTVQTARGAWRVHAQRSTFDATTLVLLLGSSLADVRREQREVVEAMVVGIPLALLLAAGGGYWLASTALRPITDMAAQAARIPLTGVEELGQSDRTDELGQLAGAFNGLVARLRAALRSQRQFMADASHELRTPVSVVRTAADVMLSREHREESEYREAMTIVGAEARRLGGLVDDMLVLARAEAGGYPLRPVNLYLDDVISECRRAVAILAAERSVTIHAGQVPEIPFRGDEGLLRQLVLNLLQNALQHTPTGGTTTINVAEDRTTVHIRITDTGPGILPENQGRIFDRFVQLDPARRGTGTGLGLPIARWIAEAHGGTLVVESSGPQGSTFRASLPHERPAADSGAGPSSSRV